LVNCGSLILIIILIIPNASIAATYLFPDKNLLHADVDTLWYPLEVRISGVKSKFEPIASGITNTTIINDKIAYSYDASVSYNIEKFYIPLYPRVKLLFNRFWIDKRYWFLIGIDTGFSSPKIRIRPSLHLGASYKYALTNFSILDFGFIFTIGGKIIDSPCLDDYNRAYHCGNLQAWSDFTRLQKKPLDALQLRYTYFFY
jgi:hypothetical protein